MRGEIQADAHKPKNERLLDGGLAGTRTLDQCLKRALLYQLSYQPTSGLLKVIFREKVGIQPVQKRRAN
jgi:hypothetical protein